MTDHTNMTLEQVRVLSNAIQVFEALEQHRRDDSRFNGSMHWKHIRGRDYLYRGFTGGRNRSLGRRSAETEALKRRFERGRAAHRERRDALVDQLRIHGGYIKVNRLNRFPRSGARIIRALDKARIPHRVIGTNALYAYETSAGVLFMPHQLATDDIDLLMNAQQSLKIVANLKKRTLLSLVKSTDKSFKRLNESPYEFAAGNARGYRVELVTQGSPDPMQPTAFAELLQQGDLQPVGIDSLKWHVASPRYSEVVFDQQGMPLRLETVDPRAFVLHKWYVSQRDDRNPAKRRRDEAHARAVAIVIASELRHLPAAPAIGKLFPATLIRQAPFDADELSI